jgi:glucose dehydrogenase
LMSIDPPLEPGVLSAAAPGADIFRGIMNAARFKIGSLSILAAALLTLALGQSVPRPQAAGNSDWPVYGGNPEGTRYSPLKQIDRTNVSRLRVAWQYDPHEQGGSEVSPIVVDGVVYTTTPGGRLIALDGATGRLKWSWDSKTGKSAVRGVTYWTDGREGRIFAGFGRYVYAIDAASGEPAAGFGADGRIDLQQNLGRDPETQSVSLTTPGIVYKDLIVFGGRTAESLPASPGDIRAYDVRTGKLRWTFHTIPHPGEEGYATWPKDAWKIVGAANNWAGMAVDPQRGIVYVPTGSAASDFYGANRVGDDLFANTLLALDAATGKRLWYFQAVKHDIWDRDLDSPPTLVTVEHDGRKVDAVAQTSKHGALFLFDRTNGKPLFPIEYRKYPPSTVPGEVAAETQPLPTRPAPFARQLLTADMLSNRTPAIHQWALDQFRTLRSEGQFVPFSVGKETVLFPGFDGGAEWGGSAFDPETGILYVNSNDIAWTSSMVPNRPRAALGREGYAEQCAGCHGDIMAGAPGGAPSLVNLRSRRTVEQVTAFVRRGSGRMPGFSGLPQRTLTAIMQYVLSGGAKEAAGGAPSPNRLAYRFTGYHKWYDPDGYPAVAPPWGTLNAINLNTGEYAWKIPLGEYPELAAQGLKETGTENYGGPIVTAGGLVFIAATNFDRKFRAFDKATGKLLWETTMVNAGNATPATYEMDGKQYIIVAAFGGKDTRQPKPQVSGGAFVAFALPDRPDAR